MCENHQNVTKKNTEFLLRVGIRCSDGKNILENPRSYVHVTGDDDDNYDYDGGAGALVATILKM